MIESVFKRLENETENEFIARVYRHKTELGMNNKEIADKLNNVLGSCYGESTLRGRGQYFNEGYSIGYEKALNDKEQNDLLSELEEKRIEIEKERKKLQTTKIELNRNLRLDSRKELFYENIKDAKDRLPLPDFNEILSYGDNEGEYILCWADLHYGAEFVSENNKYSRDICKERFEILISRVNKLVKRNCIKKLHIFGLGDDIQGMIRLSDAKLNDIPVVESVVEVSRLIAKTLNELSKNVKIEYYHTMFSNHSQTRPLTGKPDLVKEDLEFVIGNYIKDLLTNNDRVVVNLTNKDYHITEIAGQNIISMHGHQIRNVKNAIRDYSQLHRKFYDIALIGHLHGGQQMSVAESDNGNTELVIIPSFVGSDPYSDTLKVGSKAMAKLFKVEKGLGITENYTIVLN